MIKKSGIILLAIALCFVLCACDGGKTLNHTPDTATEAPRITEFVVHAFVPRDWGTPALWAWSTVAGTDVSDKWPGAAMNAAGDGWFTTSLPSWVDHLIVNGGDGTVQTEDIPIDAKELWIVVHADLTYELSYEGSIEVIQDVTISAIAPSEWDDVRCWAWADVGDVFEKWPGEAMDKNGSWHTIEVPGWVSYLIINGNNGSEQTSDLPVESGKNVWVVISCDGSAAVYYQKPTADEVNKLSHQWVAATCKNVKYCSVCEKTEGPFGDHTWKKEGCLTTCSSCGIAQTTSAHTLAAGSDGITGQCSVCNKKIEYFRENDNLYAWTEYGSSNDVVTYVRMRSKDYYQPVVWFKNGNLRGYEADSLEKGLICDAYFVNGKVYYFYSYPDANQSTVSKLANAASSYISWTNCIYGTMNCTFGTLVGPGGWTVDDRGYVHAALDLYGNEYCIAHKLSGSWDIPDDPTQTWAIPCDWMK